MNGIGRELLVEGGHVEHWLNNIKVVEYDRFSQTFKNLIKKSKFYDKSGIWCRQMREEFYYKTIVQVI